MSLESNSIVHSAAQATDLDISSIEILWWRLHTSHGPQRNFVVMPFCEKSAEARTGTPPSSSGLGGLPDANDLNMSLNCCAFLQSKKRNHKPSVPRNPSMRETEDPYTHPAYAAASRSSGIRRRNRTPPCTRCIA